MEGAGEPGASGGPAGAPGGGWQGGSGKGTKGQNTPGPALCCLGTSAGGSGGMFSLGSDWA